MSVVEKLSTKRKRAGSFKEIEKIRFLIRSYRKSSFKQKNFCSIKV